MSSRSVSLCVLTSVATVMAGTVQLTAMAAPAGAVSSCRGAPATITATNAPETIKGTAGDDVIVAGGGHDKVLAGGGNDIVCGNRGGDRIYGQAGDDRLFGQLGGAVSDGEGSGHWLGNLVDGGIGNDVLSGGPEHDMGSGFDNGEIPDRVTFGTATGGITVRNDFAEGPGIGRDRLWRDFGAVHGTKFNDTIHAAGREQLLGLAGADVLVARNTGTWSDAYGGNGNDRIDLRATEKGQGFGGNGNDRILGSPGPDFFVSGAGADRVEGRGGKDRAVSLSKGDVLRLGPGDDFVEVSGVTQGGTIRAGLGVDTLKIISGGAKANIGVRTSKNYVQTAAGRFGIFDLDRYVVASENPFGAGSFRFFGGPGNQVVRTILNGTFKQLEIRAGGGADTISLTASRRSVGAVVTGGPGNDNISGTQRGDNLRGNEGKDRADGRAGRDTCAAERTFNCERRP